jgi:hypothetical protein
MPESDPVIGYEPPAEEVVALREVHVNNIQCHIGPDSGWSMLQPFLKDTNHSLTIAMYEFYADHVVDTIMSMGNQSDLSLKMILQVDANDEQIPEQLNANWGERAQLVRAAVRGPNRIFNNSYHTKVAVRDSGTIWLSSGNWSPNSQPVITDDDNPDFLYRKGNREWHVIVENEELAGIYEKFIRYDMDMAADITEVEAIQELPDLFIPLVMLEPEAAPAQPHIFEAKTFHTNGDPVKAMPLMSPDNYANEVLSLIENAEESIYLQFSYIRKPASEKFVRIIKALAQKMKDGLDVKIIVGSNQKASDSAALIGTYKWKRSMFRQQTQKLHNKGIIIDGKIVGVGSNNWSTDGILFNRDTTLLFHSADIAGYYTEVFVFDWDNLTKPVNTEQSEMVPLIASPGEGTPPGMQRISWNEWFDE